MVKKFNRYPEKGVKKKKKEKPNQRENTIILENRIDQ